VYEERKETEGIRIENLCSIALSIRKSAKDQPMITKILAFFPPAMLQASRTIASDDIDPKYNNLITLYRDVKFSFMTKTQADHYFDKAVATCNTMEANLASTAPKGQLRQNL
jgi:hypothetical protein